MTSTTTMQVHGQIERDLFQQNSERLRYLIRVSRPNKKKGKVAYLVVVVNDVKNTHYICLVRKNDDAKSFQMKETWSLEQIHTIDGCPDPENLLEFEIVLHSKQVYKWHAYNTKDTVMFLQTIKQIKAQFPIYEDLRIVNLMNDEGEVNSFDESMTRDEDVWAPHEDAYQALTSREEADLERLIEFENTINNAEAFTEKLCKDLSSMDTLNIQDIMASEQRVLDLMDTIQSAIDETSILERRIIQYESHLKNVRDIVQKVEKKEAIMQVYKDNNARVLCEVGELVENLDFKQEDEAALARGDLDSLPEITRCHEAALRLQAAVMYQPAPALTSMNAYRQQHDYLAGVAQHFSFRFMDHLNKKIASLAQEYDAQPKSSDMGLTEHFFIHKKLIDYAPLMRWLRQIDARQYELLKKRYVEIYAEVYREEFKNFFLFLSERQVYSTKHSLNSSMNSSTLAPSPSFRRRTLNDSRRGSSTPASHTDTIDTVSTRSSEMSLSEWEEFDRHIDFMLKTIDPVCTTEQKFCEKFFDLERSLDDSSVPSTPVSSAKHQHSDTSMSNHSQSISTDYSSNSRQQIMQTLCQSFEHEFVEFVGHYNKLDGIYSFYFLVRLSQYVLSVRDTSSFLSKAYGNILIHVKRHFDTYMRQFDVDISDAKDPKRTKVGVLAFIKKFEHFAKQTEHVLKYGGSATRRADIDRWYTLLMEKIFASISRIAKEHQKVYKTPSQMIELENYHYIQNMLFLLKISCLDAERKEAKNRYNVALRDYVSLYFGRPLERLNVFFEGVQAKVAQGVREEEIGFQLSFNQHELKKIIKDVNLKDIKRGLEEMYRKVEKHASDLNSTLIQVIWRSMQEEFIVQYKSITEMIDRCYPQANISLAFSIGDVLNTFSEIAQQH